MFDLVKKNLLFSIADIDGIPDMGAYNIRVNGDGFARSSTEDVTIEPKKDKPGIDITVKPFAKAGNVHIPVIVTEAGVNDTVYNDFFIGEGAEVRIVAGCGIHNDGDCDSRHNGIQSLEAYIVHQCDGMSAYGKFSPRFGDNWNGEGMLVTNFPNPLLISKKCKEAATFITKT